MNIQFLAAELEERGRLEAILFRVLPRVGSQLHAQMVQRLAQELRKEGCVVRRPEAAAMRAKMREGR